MLTDSQLQAIMPRIPKAKLSLYREHLVKAMEEAQINTKLRIAAFLGQLALESGELKYFVEIASGEAYEGRKRLGNTQPGDGPRFKGRGPIQLTGRANYKSAGAALGVDLENNPERAADPDVAFRVAAWYWTSRKLNAKADVGDYKGITKSINGACTDGPPSHYTRRLAYYEKALSVL
jgi:putative chitinase